MFDETSKYGGVTFDRDKPLEQECERIGVLLCQKIEEYKESKKALDPMD